MFGWTELVGLFSYLINSNTQNTKLQLIRKCKRGRYIDIISDIEAIVIISCACNRKSTFDFFANITEFFSEKYYHEWMYLFSSQWGTGFIKVLEKQTCILYL